MKEYKLVVMGAGGVGKSAITVQFVQGVFLENYDPTIEDSYRKQVEIDGIPYVLEILDTAGTEQFVTMRELYTKNGNGFILVYSITSKQSLTDLGVILDEIYRVKESDNIPIVIVGNKCDLEDQRAVSMEDGQKFAEDKKCVFIEASAKGKININEIFKSLIQRIEAKEEGVKKKKKGGCKLL